MKNIREVLQDADPLRHEPAIWSAQREARRRAVLAVASGGQRAEQSIPTSRMGLFAMFAVLVIVALFVGEQVWSPLVRDVHAAVRFEVRLAEDEAGPGLREAKVSGTDRTIYLHEDVVVTNGDISAARAIRADNGYSVSVEFTSAGAEKMRAATRKHLGKPVAVLLDGQVVMAPVLRSPVDIAAEITGDFTKAEAERVVKGIIGT